MGRFHADQGRRNPDQFAARNAELMYVFCKGGDEPATWAACRKVRREKELKAAVRLVRQMASINGSVDE
jgi:hypothetical protein